MSDTRQLQFEEWAEPEMVLPYPQDDGITHVNIYSGGRTELGRFLSNFHRCVIDTVDGRFNSIEGYWYWLGTTNPGRESLRDLSGYTAKKRGRELRSKDWCNDEWFQDKIKAAIRIKVLSNQYMSHLLKTNQLPFEHYYVQGDLTPSVPTEGRWVIEYIEELQRELKAG